MAEIRIKPGATLLFECTDENGPLTGTTIASSVAVPNYKTSADFSYDLTVTPVDLDASSATYNLSAADTSTFPPGPLDCDIKYSIDGVVTFTDSFRFYVDKKVTR